MSSLERVLFIIESPLQLLGAIEAIATLESVDYLLIIRYSEERNNRQIKKIIDTFQLDKKRLKIVAFNSQRDVKNIAKMIMVMFWIYWHKKDFYKVYLGDYNSRFLIWVRQYIYAKQKVYYLDDGVASLNIQNNFTKNNFDHFFTMYDLKAYPSQEIQKHQFAYIKEYLKVKNLQRDPIVLVLGNKFYEEGLVTKEYFFKSLNQLLSCYEGKTIRYVAHRDEGLEKLNYLRKHYGFEVVQYDYPIELYGYYEHKIPQDIVSFLSTALLTMQTIYDEVNVVSYRIDLDELLDRREAFKYIYDVYENYIEVKELL